MRKTKFKKGITGEEIEEKLWRDRNTEAGSLDNSYKRHNDDTSEHDQNGIYQRTRKLWNYMVSHLTRL